MKQTHIDRINYFAARVERDLAAQLGTGALEQAVFVVSPRLALRMTELGMETLNGRPYRAAVVSTAFENDLGVEKVQMSVTYTASQLISQRDVGVGDAR